MVVGVGVGGGCSCRAVLPHVVVMPDDHSHARRPSRQTWRCRGYLLRRLVVTQKVILVAKVVQGVGTVGLGSAGRRPHWLGRHRKYSRAWWSRMRCSFGSRSCMEVVTPAVAVWEVGASHDCTASTILLRVLVAREVVLLVQVAQGCSPVDRGRARRRPRRLHRHRKYSHAWWLRRRCSCESRLCVDQSEDEPLTPNIDGVMAL